MNIYEQILAGLKTKFTGVEDATLQRIASKKAEGVTDENKVNSIVEGISFQDVLNSYGDYRADGAQKTAVQNYEKKHNIKDGKPIEDPKPTDPIEPTDPKQPVDITKQLTAALAEALKPINDKFAQMDAQKKAAEWNKQIESVAKSFDIPEYVYRGKQIDENADLTAYFTELKQEMQNNGFVFSKAPETGGKIKDDVDAFADSIAKGTKDIVEQKK